MVFALDNETGEIVALSSPVEAPVRCKPIDVRDGFWRFFAEDGSPLEPRFDPADDPDALPGPFSLERAMSGKWLQERLDQVRSVDGCGLSTVEGVAELLKINRGKRVAGVARRPPG